MNSLVLADVPDWMIALFIIGLILVIVFELFILFLLLHGDHCRILWYQLAANITIGQLPPAVFVCPGDIHMQLVKKGVTAGYCMFSSHIYAICEIAAPWLMFMFSVERLMYIRDPTGHEQKISRAGAITLLAFPWVFSIIMALVSIHSFEHDIVTEETGVYDNHTLYFCYLDQGTPYGHYIVSLLAKALPFFMSVIITLTVLILWCCYKRKHSLGRDYSMLGDEVEENVRNSVIAVAVLNALFFLLFLVESMLAIYIDFIVDGLLDVVKGILWMTTLPKVRAKLVGLFRSCCCKGKPAVPTTVSYKANEQVSVEPED